jgi:magnesium transporter
MVDDKYVGLGLAVAAGFGIGSSVVVTKKGLEISKDKHGFEGDGHQYLKSPIWWVGMVLMGLGEFANFAAYAFAPAVLVTPLGALSVLVGAVMGSYILHERLGPLGKIGCTVALIGSIIIVLHAPPDKDVETVDEILNYAIQPGMFLIIAISDYQTD